MLYAASATTGLPFLNAENMPSPMESSLMNNDTEEAIVENLLHAVEDGADYVSPLSQTKS